MNPSLSPLRLPAGVLGSRRPLRPASQLLALEQRFMFDGAVADAAHTAHDGAPPPVPPAVQVRAAEPAKDDGKKEVVVVDTSLANYKSLEAGVRDGVGIVEFDGSRNGLAQIAQWAATQSGLDAIHILSHGSEGMVNLGSQQLTESSLASAATQAELAELGRALSADGDLLLYGCDVASGSGARLLDGIARATGADVAASTDLTGAARLGGNWTLEAHSGDIDARELALTQYDGALTVVPFIYGSDGDDFTPRTSITKTVLDKTGSGRTIAFSGPEMYIYNNGSPDDGLYAYASDGSSGVRLTVSAPTGYSFDISSFGVQSYAGAVHFDVTWADGTTSSFTQGGINNTGVISTVSSFNTPLNDIRSVTITSNDFTTFQNFNITDVKALPPVAKVTNAGLSVDTGTSGSDFITQIAAQTIGGTLSANLAAGERVEVSYDNGSTWSNATTYAVGSSAWSTTTTLAGSSTFLARVSNADSASTAYSHSYALDTVAPTTSFSNMALSADTGTSGSDFITRTASQTITATLSGAPAAGDIVYGSVDGGSSWIDITSKISGTSLSWNGATLNAGSSAIMFKVTDAAGNDSALSFQNYTLDTTAPTTSVATATFSNDSGTSSTDFITNIASQTVSGTLSANLAAGERVYVSLDNGSTWTAATATVGQNTWSLSGRTLTASSTLKVRVSDTAGNDGAVRSQAYVYDTSAPTITFGSLSLSADTGASGTDFITKTASQTITATLSGAPAAGDIVYGSLDNGATWTDITGKVSGTTLSWDGVTLAGSNTLMLRVTDAAGNDGAAATRAYLLDTSTPATPGTPVLATASDTGPSSADGITADTTPTLSGTAENGSTVTLYDGATLLGTVTAGAGGWTYTTGALSQGSHTFTAVSTDAAGNVSAASAGLTITVDNVAPTVASVAVPANGTYNSGGALDFTVNFDETVTVDSTGGTPRIAIVVGATTRYADYVSGSGTSALVFRYTVPNGDLDANGITVGALSLNGGSLKDGAGNDAVTTLNSVGNTAGVHVDGNQPSVIGVSASTADGAYGSGQTITITVDFSSAVTVDASGGTPTLALDGGGIATYTGGSGSTTLTFSYIVGAGQNSADLDYGSASALALNGAAIIDAGGAHLAASVTLATPGTAGSLGANKDIVIDTAAPTNTVAGAAFSADTGTSGSDFVTRTAAQTVSGTLASNLAAGENVYVSLDNGSTWALATATVGANTWSLAGQTLTGSGTLKVRVSDDAGNNGAAYSQAYVLDTTAPTISFGNVALSADTGASNSDLITNTAVQTLSATLSAAPAAGDIVYGSLDNGATWTDITSKVSGTTLSWNGVTLASSDTLRLRVTDAAGNNGAATIRAYVLDTTAPTTSVASVAFSNDSGASASDFVTNVAAQTLSGMLSANLAAGETVYVSLDNGGTWTAATASVGTNTWSLAGQTLVASNTLLVKVSDAAGNDGAVLSQAYVLDTTGPTIVFSNLALSADTGTSSSDFITRTAAQTITATLSGAPAAGDIVYGSLDGGSTWTDITGKVSGTTLTWSGVTLAGSNTLMLRVIDDLGNHGAAHSQAYAVDTTAPTIGFGNLALSADTGTSSSDFITRTAAQTITATLSGAPAAGDIVYGSLDGGATWTDITSQVSGTTLSWNGVTLASSGTLMLKVTDAAGNEGTTTSRAYTLDTAAPTTTVTSATRADNGSVSGLLSAPLAAGETVAASLDGGATWVLATIGADGSSWSLANAGTGTLQVQVRDAAGNASATLVVDASAPAAVPQVPQVPPAPRPELQTTPAIAVPQDSRPQAQTTTPGESGGGAVPQWPGFWVSSVDHSVSALDSAALSASGLGATSAPRLAQAAGDGGFQGLVLPNGPGSGDGLVANRPIADLDVRSGGQISLQLPADTFAHADESAAIQLRALSVDGKPLPSWLRFDGRTARFDGTPPLGFEGTLQFKVVARDAQGREAVQVFKITITKDGQGAKVAHAEWGHGIAEPAGRASLNDQLRAARGAAAERLTALSQSAAAARLRA
ncbi:Ig-like domain-containing protein [Variovorax sp. M-6]|uniref:Ig-like domain-containing protein n=1 Tax=Variovorax sp. M-6 TaxID=3233041 RepID=UPI003F965A82